MNTILWKDDGYSVGGDEGAEIGPWDDGTGSPEEQEDEEEVLSPVPETQPSSSSEPRVVGRKPEASQQQSRDNHHSLYPRDMGMMMPRGQQTFNGFQVDDHSPTLLYEDTGGPSSAQPGGPFGLDVDGASDLFQPLLVQSEIYAPEDVMFFDDTLELDAGYAFPPPAPRTEIPEEFRNSFFVGGGAAAEIG